MGTKLDGGSPRWRNFLGLLPQVCVMPSLWVASVLVPGSASVFAAVFANVFGSMLLFDLCAIKYNAMMLAHHWLCLAGHCFAMSVAPEAFGRYFGAVVALELGSATSCSWWMWGGEWPRALDALYGGGMTLSNGLGAAQLLRWAHGATSLPLLARCAPVPIVATLLFFRQKEMLSLLRFGRAVCSTEREGDGRRLHLPRFCWRKFFYASAPEYHRQPRTPPS